MILSRIDNWHQLIDVVDDSVRFWKICTGNQMIDSKWFDTPQFRIIINNKQILNYNYLIALFAIYILHASAVHETTLNTILFICY